jgi:hypothetical protein
MVKPEKRRRICVFAFQGRSSLQSRFNQRRPTPRIRATDISPRGQHVHDRRREFIQHASRIALEDWQNANPS